MCLESSGNFGDLWGDGTWVLSKSVSMIYCYRNFSHGVEATGTVLYTVPQGDLRVALRNRGLPQVLGVWCIQFSASVTYREGTCFNAYLRYFTIRYIPEYSDVTQSRPSS